MPQDPDKDMENLSKAIVKAILDSEDVKRALEKIQQNDAAAAKSMMVFMVRLDSLTEYKEKDFHELKMEDADDDVDKIPPMIRKKRKKQEKPTIVDGRVLSRKEAEFLDFISKNFDTDAWLKKLKITLD